MTLWSRSHSLQQKIITAIVMVGLLPLSLSLLLSYVEERRALREAIGANFKEVAVEASRRTEMHVTRGINEAQQLGTTPFLRITFVFGAGMAEAALASQALIVLVGAGMIVAALIALSRQDIRERLAYSCMAQSLAVVMGALLSLQPGAFAPAGLFAAALQFIALSCAAATLLMAAGTTAAITGRTKVADYAGLGRVMPWTFAGFAIASASMIGMPPFAGAWATLWLITAAAGSGLIWAAVLAAGAAILTFTHLAPLAANALATRAPTDAFKV